MKVRGVVQGIMAIAAVGDALVAQAQTYSRTDTIVYADNLSKWVIGQTVSSTNTNTGVVESKTDYDPVTALPIKHYGPGTTTVAGKLVQTLTYNADGTVATVKDGNNNVTTLSSWYRSVPRTIQYPATPEAPSGATQTAVVNALGWITAVTDENGYKSCYAYDAMGRMAEITYTSETTAGTCDATAWNKTTQVFEKVAGAEVGIAGGHWRQTVSTGNARKIVYFDGQWRPLVTREYDTAIEATTKRFQRFAYDHEGRAVFASYPGSSDALTTGTWTSYDALGRTTSMAQDTELTPSLQVTTTEYLTGFKTRVTNPRGQQTTTSYLIWDKPSTDLPLQIDYPLSTRTVIDRNLFLGRTDSLTRSNVGGNPDLHADLCLQRLPGTVPHGGSGDRRHPDGL